MIRKEMLSIKQPLSYNTKIIILLNSLILGKTHLLSGLYCQFLKHIKNSSRKGIKVSEPIFVNLKIKGIP